MTRYFYQRENITIFGNYIKSLIHNWENWLDSQQLDKSFKIRLPHHVNILLNRPDESKQSQQRQPSYTPVLTLQLHQNLVITLIISFF